MLAFIDGMTRDASNIPDTVAKNFVDAFSPKERVEISIVAAAMGMLNKINDALRIPIENEVIDQALAVPELVKGDKALEFICVRMCLHTLQSAAQLTQE